MKNARFLNSLLTLMLFAGIPVSCHADDDFGRDRVSKTFTVASFTAIEVNVPCDLMYVPSSTPEFQASAYSEKILSNLKVEVKNGVLVLKWDDYKRPSFRRSNLRIYVGSKYLNNVEINGAADFEADRGIVAKDDFKLVVNGSGDTEINSLKAKTVSVNVNGAADTEISGLNSDVVNIQINGAGDCELSGRAKTVDIRLNGAGDVDISDLIFDKLNTAISGVGRIEQ